MIAHCAKRMTSSLTSSIFRCLPALTLLLFSAANAHTPLPPGLAVSMQAVKNTFAANDVLRLRIEYTNVSQRDIRFLTRDTALEGEINDDFLRITFDGQQLEYIGRHAKRLPPTESEYVRIKPGQSVSGTVDVGFAYPVYEKGEYQIDYNGAQLLQGPFAKTSDPTILRLSEDRPVVSFKRPPIISASCNATQRAQINQALSIAANISRTARDALNNAPVELRPNARRFTEWFGAYSPGRYATAQTAFNRITSALFNQRIGFDCTCDINNRENVFAFVFKNDPFNMNVCPVFFRVGPSGTDSRSGTIVHEISHFNVVISSDDFSSALNQAGSRQLARFNPSAAIRNANAFEYFAENTPFLPMPTAADLPDPADLSVSQVNVSENGPTVEDPVDVTATIINSGETQSAATSVSVRLSTDSVITFGDTQIAQGSLPALQPNASFNFVSQIQAPSDSGEFWIGVCVSSVSGETEVGNNCSIGVPFVVEDRITIPPILFLLLGDDEEP